MQRASRPRDARMAGAITESLRNIELVKSLGLTSPRSAGCRATRRIFDLEMQKVRQVRSLAFLQGTTLQLLKHRSSSSCCG